jgi:predicted dithiol-disulfide oxidoreductase (DUF899 family)
VNLPPVVAPEEWQAARAALLAQEKEATRTSDALAAERPQTPAHEWLRRHDEYEEATR